MIPVKKQGGRRHFRSTLFDSSGALDKHCFPVLLWTHTKSIQDKEVVMLNIVFVECNTLGDDLDWSRFSDLGHVSFLNSPPIDEIPDLVADADIIVINKAPMNAVTLAKASHVKLICVTATGTNILDKDYLDERGIAWTNVAGYATESVAQHTFACLFYLLEKLPYYDHFVKCGDYEKSPIFTNIDKPFFELKGKTWGIIGLGTIGRRVADIARAFGCRVVYFSASGAAPQEGYDQVDFDTLLAESDVVSVHAPLNSHTEHLMNRDAFKKMKPSAYFINVGRGPIVVEQDLADAINAGDIAGAALDVMDQEPPSGGSPLLSIQDSEKLIITPHIAWASNEARRDLMGTVYEQIKEFTAQQ